MTNSPTARRIGRLQHALIERGIDACVVSNPNSFRYFTGHLPLLTASPTRSWFLLVPASGDPIVCLPSIGRDDFAVDSYLADVRSWPSPNPNDEGRSVLTAAVAELGVGIVGLELGREMRPAMSISDLDTMRAALSSIEWVDAAEAIWSVRSIKGPEELDAIRRSIAAANVGFREVRRRLRAGMTERDVARIMVQATVAGGADAVRYLACCSGPGGYPSLTRQASNRVLEDGDVVGLDLGAVTDGYWCDFDRNFAVGRVPVATRAAIGALDDAVAAARAVYRPGTSLAELRRAMSDAIAVAGLEVSPGGRWGHGSGLDLTEPPSVSEADDAVLQAGMVITLEPVVVGHLADRRLGLVAEEMATVTDGGHEFLTEDVTTVEALGS